MKTNGIFHSFRARLLLVLALLLVATLGVQHYFHAREHRRRLVVSTGQQQALAASVELAIRSVSSGEYLYDLDRRRGEPFLRSQGGRVTNILVVNEEGRVDDSLAPEWMPKSLEDGSVRHFRISDVPLPRRVNAGRDARDVLRFINAAGGAAPRPSAVAPRAFVIPLRTGAGLKYLFVLLGVPEGFRREPWERAVIPLLPTLAAMLFAAAAVVFLLQRFTRPLYDLSRAARKVTEGDFSFEVRPPARRDEVGELVSTFNDMVNDLGRMRELEVRIKQAEQSAVIGRLASAIAHDIRSPLGSINDTLDRLRASLLPDDPSKRGTVERLTSQLKAEVARIDARIREFMKYTRPSVAVLRPLDLAAEVDDALGLVEVQAADSGVATVVERGGEVPQVWGDAEALRSVFTNLFINALHAMEGSDGGRLTVRLSAEAPGRVRVEVSDTGRGIAAGDLEHIFEPYFSTKETGTGLGLAIVRKVVEDHGGSVRVESAPGEGATFTVLLPARPAPLPALETSPAPADS